MEKKYDKKNPFLKQTSIVGFLKNYFTFMIDLIIQFRNCTLRLLKFIIYYIDFEYNNDPSQKVSKNTE